MARSGDQIDCFRSAGMCEGLLEVSDFHDFITDVLEPTLMEELFKEVAGKVALGVEVIAVLIVAYGASEAFLRILKPMFGLPNTHGERKETWRRFGVWLLLGLEFELAADIVRSVISPTWLDIGQLAAIAVIRTFLNYFLEKDVERYAESRQKAETPMLATEAARASR